MKRIDVPCPRKANVLFAKSSARLIRSYVQSFKIMTPGGKRLAIAICLEGDGTHYVCECVVHHF